jgi:antirestriction protein ArdC
MSTERKDVYSRITSQIVPSLENGIRPQPGACGKTRKTGCYAASR